jgi:DNA glycosylase AlkZ-like
VRTRLFRAVASPGAVLRDGALAGTWRVKAAGAASAFSIQRLAPLDGDELERECARIARLRGADAYELELA